MNQRKAKNLIRNQLYQIDGLFVRSEKEARELAADCRVSARALILRAEARSNLPSDAWTGFYRALDAAERRASGDWREALREAIRSLRRHGQLVIGGLIIALALAFFTLVPAGRAIAQGIFNYVISVFDKQLEIEQTDEKALYEARGYDVPEVLTEDQMAEYGYDADGNLIMEKEPVYYDSVAAFESVYYLDAFELTSDLLTCVEVVEHNNIFTGKSLRIRYQTVDGKIVSLLEQWYLGDGQSVFTNGAIQEHAVLGGRTMQYAIDESNGSFDGIVLLDHSILMVYADAGVDLELIWDLLK